MKVLSMNEVQQVSGGMTLDQGLDIIGGASAVAACIPGCQGAAAFGAGVYLGGKLVEYLWS